MRRRNTQPPTLGAAGCVFLAIVVIVLGIALVCLGIDADMVMRP